MEYIYALGFFDGVHRGHAALLERATALALDRGCRAGVVTFASHPDTLVTGITPMLINTPADRELLLRAQYPVEKVLTLPFDKTLRDTPWEDFLKDLRAHHHAVGFVCGDDFRFGARGLGTPRLLGEYAAANGLAFAEVPQQSEEGVRISSTYIRGLIEAGDMERAEEFLGHPHILTGTVIHGKALGRTLGIPTANLQLPEGLVVPKFGVYACLARVNGKKYPAVTNVGTRPTVAGRGITVEPWLLNFQGDLYDREITLEFHKFLRPERKFSSLEALQQEIFWNARQTESFFETHKCNGILKNPPL